MLVTSSRSRFVRAGNWQACGWGLENRAKFSAVSTHYSQDGARVPGALEKCVSVRCAAAPKSRLELEDQMGSGKCQLLFGRMLDTLRFPGCLTDDYAVL